MKKIILPSVQSFSLSKEQLHRVNWLAEQPLEEELWRKLWQGEEWVSQLDEELHIEFAGWEWEL